MARRPHVVGGWQTLLHKTAKGKLLPNLHNVRIVMTHDPRLMDIVGYDEMAYEEVLLHPVGGSPLAGLPSQPVGKVEVLEIQSYIQQQHLLNVGRGIVEDAITLRANGNKFHPIREQLNSLQWDRQERLKNWLSIYAGVIPGTPYSQCIGKLFFINMVRRVFVPGCQVDYMLILQTAAQGKHKSSLGRVLAGEKHFSDSLPDVRDIRKVGQHLRNKWVVEVPEMHGFSPAKIEAWKVFIPRRSEKYLSAYGHYEVDEPRQCVLLGNANRYAIFHDETGNRRFWPIEIDNIDIDFIGENRDQILAEALVLWNIGGQENGKWYPDPAFEQQFIVPEQDARFIEDLWQGPVEKCINGRQAITTEEIATYLVAENYSKTKDLDGDRLHRVMTRAGYVNKRLSIGRGWEKR